MSRRATLVRSLAVGAEVTADGAHFRVWAPRRRQVEVVIEGAGAVGLAAESDGYFAGTATTARAGSLYRYRLDGGSTLYPDPASRFQPRGPHGPSEVVDPRAFEWTDGSWQGAELAGQVVYEMHIGTFTREGTWSAATEELGELARLGVSVLEIMPVADFPGRFGWGYDGVNWFAPTWLYGRPDDFRKFVDRAHALGLAVILDVVYNHLGPDGNFLGEFSGDYFSTRHETEWGAALNYDGKNCAGLRELVIGNAAYWVREFHLDGLRLDATQSIFDDSPQHILADITHAVRSAAGARKALVIGENEPQESRLIVPVDAGGYGLDAVWNDDYHHSAMVALTGKSEAYYADYRGSPQELISAIKRGYLFQGQVYAWQKKPRGTPSLDFDPAAYVLYLQNHDQVANSGRGLRAHALTSAARCRALTALTLLAPGTPMLFQGQEFGATAPFLFFADHEPSLAKLVSDGRQQFLAQFAALALPDTRRQLAEPSAPSTFERCKLDFSERAKHAETYSLHIDLLALRKSDPVFRRQRRGAVDGAVLADQAFVLRHFGEEHGDRLLVVNLGHDVRVPSLAEPLLAPARAGAKWATIWSSEDVRYGGDGMPPWETAEGIRIPAECAVVLAGE